MKHNFISGIIAPTHSESALWFIFQNDHILLQKQDDQWIVPLLSPAQIATLAIAQPLYVGEYNKISCFSTFVPLQPNLTNALQWQPIRQAATLLNDPTLFVVVVRTKQLLHWNERTLFCGQCGHKTSMSLKERVKECSACKALFYPHLAPVMLALIWRPGEILLGRSPYFLPNVYSILAGFVEPGETLENAVHREVKEEVGLSVKNLHYFGSQPWPFPSNLMLGFMAEYAGGEIVVDTTELEDAKWFALDALPSLPNQLSLSRQMIEHHLTHCK